MRNYQYCKHCGEPIGYTSTYGTYYPEEWEDFNSIAENTTEDTCDNCFEDLYRYCPVCKEYHMIKENFTLVKNQKVCDYHYDEKLETQIKEN